MAEKSDAASTPWSMAVKLLTQWIETGDRVDAVLDTVPPSWTGPERARIQNLFFGAVRHFGRIQGHLEPLMTRPPRPRLRAILLAAGFEIIEGGDNHHVARVVHHAVEQAKTLASPAEARLVNAVVRKLADALKAETLPPKLASDEKLASYFSHPLWLVRRWLSQFGASATRELLEWNQLPAPVYARWRDRERGPTEEELAWLHPTAWENYYEVQPGHWKDVSQRVEAGLIYLQDPSTRLAVQLLDPRPGETILDLCAAPGGKSLQISDTLRAREARAESAGRVVAMDLPGPRIERLKENLARVKGVEVALVQGDLATGPSILKLNQLPEQFAAVLIDVPCSNTGVMRHRIDVKWRLQENDFAKHGRQQLALLRAAARFVGPGGRLVYSTCSLDTEENEKVVEAFLVATKDRYRLKESAVSRPWETRHDGAAAYLFERIG